MNCKNRNKYVLIILLIVFTNILLGCKNQLIEEDKVKYNINLNNGAIAIENNGEYQIYNLNNGKYEKECVYT